MPISLKEIEDYAVAWAPEDRARLAEVLLESLQEPTISQIEAAWEIEIAQHIANWQGCHTKLYAAADVLAEARKACR